MSFKDHFSGYAAHRPTYPAALFAYLTSLAPGGDLAWDCATGSGQTALGLAPHFSRVVATDASPQQLAEATPHERVEYRVAPAERTPLPDNSIDLVTVAQALHWLDPARFYAEARRVARPGGVLAAWCYQLHSVNPVADAVFRRLYDEVVGPYWPPERRLVEAGYRTLSFPFEEIETPPFVMTRRWDLGRLVGYVGTWSASRRYLADRGTDPLEMVRRDLEAAWGDPGQERLVTWPLHLRAGRIAGDP